jgi:MFS family permease
MPPSRARYGVVVFAITLAILAYVDRVSISQAAPLITRDLGLTRTQMGAVFSAFALSYAAFEIPGGWLGDRLGAKRVLIRIVLMWSLFTALTGAAFNYVSLWITRFLFGMGEAGCFPNITKMYSVWLRPDEHAPAQGLMWTFARWGGAFTPPLVILVLRWFDWRGAFVLFGAIGIVWCVFFARWYRDDPLTHPALNAAERELLRPLAGHAGGHTGVPWRRLFSSGSLWLLWIQYFLLAFGWYFFITWLPTYLQEARRLTAAESARFAVIPLFFGGFGALLSGFLLPRLGWRIGVKAARKSVGAAGILAGALFFVLSNRTEPVLPAMLWMGVASFCCDLVLVATWSSCMDMGGRWAGTASGVLNMMGNFAGAASPYAGSLVLERTGGDWTPFLYLLAGAWALAMLCWLALDPQTPVDARPL